MKRNPHKAIRQKKFVHHTKETKVSPHAKHINKTCDFSAAMLSDWRWGSPAVQEPCIHSTRG